MYLSGGVNTYLSWEHDYNQDDHYWIHMNRDALKLKYELISMSQKQEKHICFTHFYYRLNSHQD